MKQKVWILVGEAESGSIQGFTYWILGVFDSKEKAEKAEDNWRKEHGETNPHEFEGDDPDWCEECGQGVVIHEQEVS